MALILVLALAGCTNANKATSTATSSASAVAAASPVSAAASPTAASLAARGAATPPVSAPVSGALSPTPAAGAGTPSATDSAIMATIQRADNEQAQALARQDPTLMRDTATPAYYASLVKTLVDLSNGGVTAIALQKLEWGPLAVQGSNAQATTFETWQTTFADGSSAVQSRDRNIYTLVQQGGTWLIAADAHPDTQLNQPPPSADPGTGQTPSPASASSGQSRNWSGYVASGGPFTSVTGSWTVPAVQANTAAGAGGNATWVGIGGAGSFDLIQAGTQATVLGPGQVAYGAWIETLPQPSQSVSLTVNPGDAITVTLNQQSSGLWQISIVDQTTTQQFQTTVQYNSSLSSAEWIEEAPSVATVGLRVINLDDFGSVQFHSATTIDGGKQETVAQAGGQPTTMYGRGGQPLAAPSPLGSDGASFTITRQSGGSPSPQVGG